LHYKNLQVLARLFLTILIIISFSSCFSRRPEERFLPKAKGQLCEILIVIDSSLWNSPLSDTLKTVFSSAFPGLPQSEPYFDLDIVNPLGMNTLQKQSRNIVFVSVLNNASPGNRGILANFTNESLEIIEEDSSIFSFSKTNAYANGQQVLHLFGKDIDLLIRNLSINKEHLRALLLNSEMERLASSLISNEQSELTKDLEKQFGLRFEVSTAYKTIKQDNGFLWLKLLTEEVDKNLFLSQKDYRSEQDFKPENILAWRQQIANRYLMDESGKPETIPSIQNIIPPIQKATNLGGLYAIETRALWQTKDLSKGGTLISYVLVNPTTQKMIYLEAFISAPGKDKRDLMLEMEAVLRTIGEVK